MPKSQRVRLISSGALFICPCPNSDIPTDVGFRCNLTVCIARLKGAQVQAVYRVADEVSQMALGQPFLQCTGQKALLIGLVGNVACVNPKLTHDLTLRC